MKWLARIGIGLAVLAVGGFLFALAVRFHAGPIGPFPGGAMDGPVTKDALVDWSFAADLDSIALQTSNPPRSRTVWFVLHEGALYVPSGMAASKTWPQKVAEDPVVLLGIESDLYIRTALKVSDPAERATTWALVSQKYGVPDGNEDPRNWMYRMDPFDALAIPATP